MPSIRGRSSYHSAGLWAIKAKNGGKFPVVAKKAPKETTTTITKKFGKGTRTVVSPKSPRFYPTEKVSTSRKHPKRHNPAKIRDSIQAGTVAIVLSGKFRGKRVVVLKRLSSGLVLVSGMSFSFHKYLRFKRTIQDQRCSAPSLQPCLPHCHLHQG